MRRIAWLFILSLVLPMAGSAQVTALVETEVRIPWTEATPGGLDALLVYADLPGKHPLVVMTHGTSRDADARRKVTPWKLLPQARWFALRGFVVVVVVRRGYGGSGGHADNYRAARCPLTDYQAESETAAQDMAIALAYAARLPQVDPARVVAVGISTGGMATVALTAHPPPGLVAAINFAGGRGSIADNDVCNPAALVSAYRDFGRRSRVPMLWIYAQNDKYFGPALAQQFDAAFRSSGGQDQLIQAPAFGDDGHFLFDRGIDIWSPWVDAFLNAHGLTPLPKPLPEPAPPAIPPPAGLSEKGQVAFRLYLTLGPNKAFAVSAHHYAFAVAEMYVKDAHDKALEHCNRLASASSETCHIVFEENTPVQ